MGRRRGRGRRRVLAHGRAIRAEREAADRGARAPAGRPAGLVGRRDDRLPPADDRLAELHAEPRGDQPRRSRKGFASPRCWCPRRSWSTSSARRRPWCASATRGTPRKGPPIPSGEVVTLPRADDPGRRRHPAEHRARPRGPGATFRSTASTSRPWTRTATRPVPSGSPSRPRSSVLMSMRPDGRVDQLLRRPAPLLRRQRGEGDGQRQAGLSDRLPGPEPGGADRRRRRGTGRPARTTSCARWFTR